VFAVISLLESSRSYGAQPKEQEPPSITPATSQSLSPETRGDVLMARRNYLAAINAYELAPRDSAVVWTKIGIAYHHLSAIDIAKTDYQRALLLEPDYAPALNNLGAVFYAQKDYHKAEKFYRRALKLAPHSAVIYTNLGTAYFAEHKFKQGSAAYHTAFTIDPSAFGADPGQNISESTLPEERAHQDYCLAELFAHAGMTDKAIVYLRKALDEGFSDRKRLMQDQELAMLRKTPQFAQLAVEEKLQF
jgi:tetratricopeptide (TPR) repeat protein